MDKGTWRVDGRRGGAAAAGAWGALALLVLAIFGLCSGARRGE